MLNRLRRMTAAVCLVALITGTMMTATATATGRRASSILNSSDSEANNTSTPVLADLIILRPLGLAAMALSAVLFVIPVAPITLLTRPSEIAKPTKRMIMDPARFVWVDPLGSH
jgi:hypothetical protein